jgi:hypothetical protein
LYAAGGRPTDTSTAKLVNSSAVGDTGQGASLTRSLEPTTRNSPIPEQIACNRDPAEIACLLLDIAPPATTCLRMLHWHGVVEGQALLALSPKKGMFRVVSHTTPILGWAGGPDFAGPAPCLRATREVRPGTWN